MEGKGEKRERKGASEWEGRGRGREGKGRRRKGEGKRREGREGTPHIFTWIDAFAAGASHTSHPSNKIHQNSKTTY